LACHGQARMVRESDPVEPFHGAVMSNELFDALPAQPWRWNGSQWAREVLTATGPNGNQAKMPSLRWFESQGEPEPGDGSVWCEALPTVVHHLTSTLTTGLFLAIDYGESASRLLAKGAICAVCESHGGRGMVKDLANRTSPPMWISRDFKACLSRKASEKQDTAP